MKREMKAKLKTPQEKKKTEKFRVTRRVSPLSPLFYASFIEWKPSLKKNQAEPLLVTVSRTSGSAVMRNRWKRLIKEWFYSEGRLAMPELSIPGQSIWIRFNRTKILKKPIHYKDWANMLNTEVFKLKNVNTN